jgi:long-chain acyl-CoA synthetase
VDLSHWAGLQPDKLAYLGSDGVGLSYGQLEKRSNQVAHLLRKHGLQAGDHVALLTDNTVDLFPIVWGAQRAGLLYTLVNWHLTPDEASYIVENCEAKVLVASGALADLASKLPATERRLSFGGEIEGFEPLDPALETLPGTPLADQVEGYYMLYSSGTTGRPKGILPKVSGAPFGTGLAIDHLMAQRFGFDVDTTFLSTGPLYHAAPLGWSLGAIRNGGTVVVMDRFDPLRTLQLIEHHRVTHAQFVPTMFVRMLKLDESVRQAADLSSLRLVVHAAAACPVEVKHAMIHWVGEILVEFYAGSEGNCFFMIDSWDWLCHPGSVGRAVTSDVHILDDEGNELPVGTLGQVWFSGGSDFEYHGDSGKTAQAHNDRGWSTLGDLGRVDADGYLYLSDRRTDLIVSGGVNIYPREIEDALILHPAVADVAVIGLRDAEYGRRVHAVVAPAARAVPGPDLEAELLRFLRERVAGFKLPRSMTFEDVPRLPSGKVLRRALLERYSERYS